MPGKIISVFSNKGGIAKTTTTVTLGHALATEGLKVAVGDVDSQCNTTETLVSSDISPNLTDVFKGDKTIEDIIVPAAFQAGLFCIPNSPDIVGLEHALIKMGSDGFGLLRDRIREFCQTEFDVTIIDNPPNHGIFVINALFASDFAIVPTESASKNSVKGLQKALKFIGEIRNDGNPDLKFLKMLVTKVDNRTGLDKMYLKQLKAIFGDKVFNTHIPINVDFKYAENDQITIYQKNGKAPGGKAYRKIAKEVIELLKTDQGR